MFAQLLRTQRETAYALLRLGSGSMFAFHGAQKILGVFGASQPAVGTQMWVGGLIELIAGAAITLGSCTAWAAFLASGTMFVAYAQFHWKLAFGAQFFPAINKGELALVYCLVFFYIACHGSGKWSLDARRHS